MYYLQSRYYDPAIGRFINADIFTTTDGNGVLSCNMFAYCENNPISRSDPSGQTFIDDLWSNLVQNIKEAAPLFATFGAITQADSPLIGPGDAIGSVAALGTLAYFFVKAVDDTLSARSDVIALPNPHEQASSLSGTRTKNQYNYWRADLVKNRVVVTTPLTLQEACLRVSMGGSVMCRNEAAARTLVGLNGYRNFVGPEIHGECGYYPHFHPTRNHNGYCSIHIWFLNS